MSEPTAAPSPATAAPSPATAAPSPEGPPPSGNARKVVAALLACALVAAALTGWALFRAIGDDEGNQAQNTPPRTGATTSTAPRSTPPPSSRQPTSAATSAPASPSSRPPSPTGATEAVPAGFTRHTDATGFSLAVPAGWTADRQGERMYFREPGGSRFLIIDQTDQPKPDPVADWRQQEAARRDGYQDYERIRIEPVEYFEKAADWEFTYATPSGRRHVLIRGVVTSDRQAYGIYWSTPESRWDESRALHRIITDTFQPAT
ncbi:hypothetical protein E1218_25115 [Kribbella turkmenica]|uniref:Serine/threonine protein kinase n=1 Tax=Kribbella turkmenica TaxID=2530375 RepID=A0A4V2YED4_9ACTN|nr:hypothetical protein E1218_25115 [Kribbella turkmenica]